MIKINDIDEIVRQSVADAIRTGELLHVNKEAWRIATDTGLPWREIAQELFEAGIAARINMELGARSKTAVKGLSRPEGLGAV